MKHHRNSVLYDSGSGLREHSFMMWPSVGVRVNPDLYMLAVEYLKHASDVYFDGDLIIIPLIDKDLIANVSATFDASVILFSSEDGDCNGGFGARFATKAIEAGLPPELVVRGDGLSCYTGETESLLIEALEDPVATISRWRDLSNSAWLPN